MVEEKGMALVGGRRLAYTVMGSGSPVVVLESAFGAPGSTWETVLPAIADFARVICYDRPGLGESERAEPPRKLTDFVRDLKGLLDSLGIPGPFLLVGNSFGGYIVRYFAYQHPNQVAGLVLIESSHPDSARRMLEVMPPPAPNDSDFIKEMRASLISREPEEPGDNIEGIDFSACDDQASEASSLGDLPLVVIAAANHAKDEGDPINDPALVEPILAAAFERQHLATQAELTRLSSRGRFVTAQESGHFVHRYEPDLVVGILKEMVENYRSGATSTGD